LNYKSKGELMQIADAIMDLKAELKDILPEDRL
jgi:hypothetical protein